MSHNGWPGAERALLRAPATVAGWLEVACFASLIGFHLLAVGMFWHIDPPAIERPPERMLEAFLIAAAPPPSDPPPRLRTPIVDVVPAPDIEISAATPSEAITQVWVAPNGQLVPPRPDPAHVNAAFAFAGNFVAGAANVSALLQVFVLRDGSISDARIVRSSGNAALDQLLLAHVKAHWRFLPASYGGTALQDWTTVLVPVRHA